MNKQEYMELRNGLYSEAENLINAGSIEDANSKMKEIENLDKRFENEAISLANLNALKDKTKITSIENNSVTVKNYKVLDSMNAETDLEDITASADYRKAFMNNIIKGEDMPQEFMNIDSNTKTTDVGILIPSTVVEKIVEKIEATGMILPLVNRTAIKGGVTIPTSTLKPVATWVAEGGTSDKQKKSANGTISFAYHKLRCAVSVSLETDVMALGVFEATLIKNVAEAMTKALEQSIVSGDGNGKPKGILTETPNVGQDLEFAVLDYDTLIDAEAALPLEYEANAVYCMTKKTFMEYQKIKDTTGQPIARVNYGIGGKPERSLLGRTAILCNYLDSFSTTLEVGKPFAFLFNFQDYTLNTNFNMGLKKYEDNETEDQITKAVMLVDGKVVDKGSLVILKKKA
ncbi:phage major capsid protein [Clostridium sp. UBA3887]|uniref:phage major capsid protein n=1 Tax=Clostridium sp. UBA3887 TaxID=1946356 RepID=UPI003216E34E